MNKQYYVLSLPKGIARKLDEYGFDYQKNFEEWCRDIFKEILKSERKEKDE